MDAVSLYTSIRRRVVDLAASLTDDQWARPVPACPAWTVHDLLSHMALLPAALAAGDLPTGEVQPWLDGIVDRGRDRTPTDLVAAWPDGAALGAFLSGGALLLVDLAVHEQDLRCALGLPVERATPEATDVLACTLISLAGTFEGAGLDPVEVRHDGVSWRSGDGEPGWSLHVDPWEAVRILESRRTANEVLAAPGTGGGPAYVAALHAHSPLPDRSLAETR